MLRLSLDTVVGSVESVMSGISDEMAKERRRREGEERNRDEWALGLEQKGVREKGRREI